MKNYHKRKLWVKGVAVILLSLLVACSSGGNGNDGGSESDSRSDVVDFQASPDGNFVAYIADQNSDEVFELFVVELATLTVTQVSGTLVSGGDVLEFKWAPDSSRIAYLADQDINDVFELYSVKPDGTENVRQSGLLTSGRNVATFKWAPDSSRIAYSANQDFPTIVDLYTTLPGVINSDRIVSSGLNNPGSQVEDFAWAPNSSRIAYRADRDILNVFELFTTFPTETTSILVSGPLVASRNVEDFAWAPDSLLLVYLADQDQDDVLELYVTTPIVTVSTRITAGLVAGRNVEDFAWAPDSSLIAYIADLDTDNVFELYTTPPDGSVNNLVSAIDPIAVPGSSVIDFAWAPDSSLIAYLADQVTNDVNELFTSPPDGSVNNLVSGIDPITVPGSNVLTYIWAPDSSRIAYRADQDTNEVLELYSANPAPTAGPDFTKVSAPLGARQNVEEFSWAPDSSRIAYRADQDTLDVIEVYTTNPLAVSDFVKVSGSLVAGGNVEEFEWDPTLNSSFLTYRADQDTLDVFELYKTDPHNNTNAIKISGPF
jgi:Tol biopolymer transport system component